MASFTLSFSLLITTFSIISISKAQSSFSLTTSTKDSNFALYGDAKHVVDDGGSTIQIADSVSHDGDGRVVYKKPIEYIGFVGTKTEYTAGFSTSFSFSISPHNYGGSLGFVMFPFNRTIDHSLFEVKFETFDYNVGVIVDVDSVFNKIQNFTVSNSDKKKKKEEKLLLLYVWVNYLGGGKFLEVRLSESKSYDESVHPMMFYRTDLSEMLRGEEEFMVGIKSFSGSFKIHSWSLETRLVSKYDHSYVPLIVEEEEEEAVKKKRRETMWEIVTCFIMTFGSTGLVFFGLMHIWTAFKRNNVGTRMMSPEECGLKTKEFEYEKMEKIEVVMK